MFGQQLAFRHFFFATGTSGHTKVSKENTDFIKYSYFMYLHKSCNKKIIFIYVAHLNTKFIMCFDKVNVGNSGGEYNWKNA